LANIFGSIGEPSRAQEVIAELVKRIMGYAVGATKALVPDNSPRALPILWVHIFFNYQWVDRVASKVLGAGRPSFMDSLRGALDNEIKTALYSHLAPPQRQRAVDGLNEALDGFMLEFAEYGAPASQGAVKGTLFWEFGKKVANMLGHVDQAFMITAIAGNTMAGVKAMDVPGLLRTLTTA